MIGVFGLLVLALAGVGIYGVLSYSVTQRRVEVGIRMALGASGRSVLGLVLKEGLFLAGFGIVLGWIGAASVSKIFSRFLYGVEATDGATYLVSTVVLALVALSCALLPALRASRTDPLLALRRE